MLFGALFSATCLVLAAPTLAQTPPVDAAVPDVEPADAGVVAETEPADVAATAAVEGEVRSLQDRKPLAAAKVYVTGEPLEAETGLDGRFTLTLTPGAHRLTVIHGLHETQIADVEVVAGQVSTLQIELTPAQLELDDYVVSADRIKGTVATVLAERRESASVTDAISVADISKSPDGTASAATRRIVGATIVGGQFLYVRGLGGRYTNVRLNGVPLPSTDPDLPGFQLDLFPASLLSSLNVVKTFTPDIPGDFAGGSMNIVTRDFPEKMTVTASIGLSSTSESVGQDVLSYPGGDFDALGFDDGTRDLPDEVAPQRLETKAARDEFGLSSDDVDRIGQSFNSNWETTERSWLPNTNMGFSFGDTTKLASRRLGYLVTLGYRYSLQRSVEDIKNVVPETEDGGEPLKRRETLRREQGVEKALLGALATASYELAKDHSLSVVSMLTQSSEDKVSLVLGHVEQNSAGIQRTQFRFIERQLFFNQLLGHHDLLAAELDWQANVSTVARDQPDSRDISYLEFTQEGDGRYRFDSAERLYTELDQMDFGGGLDLTVPVLDATKLKAGYLGRTGDRKFAARRFRPQDISGFDASELDFLPANERLASENVGEAFRYIEQTNGADAYDAVETLHAGYAMLDTPTVDWLRVTGGARLESFRQSIDVGSPFATAVENMPATVRVSTDVLPAAALVFALSDKMNIRAAYGGTVARPFVRELAPFPNQDYIKRRVAKGNPDLLRTYVHNLDLRWELFPSDVEVFAASVFYKVFQHPIESVVLATGDITYENIDGARNYGFELEGRIGLDRFEEGLEDFSFGANFAWIQSDVELSLEQRGIATSSSRPMAGQSPYVANLSLGYASDATGLSLNLFYNVYGPRIQDVGRDDMPDIYEQAFHSLDFTAAYKLNDSFTLSGTATNLLAQSVRVREGNFQLSRIYDGVGFGVSLAFKN